ncbi:hypothetical protein [Kitasatospora sp. NPDC001683]
MREERPYWNTNVARHAGILRAAAPGMSYREVREAAGRVLPGCGTGGTCCGGTR